MKQPLHFKRVLLIALGMMTGVYALMGVMGYGYFGNGASQLITADLEAKSVLSHMRIFGAIRVTVFTVVSEIPPAEHCSHSRHSSVPVHQLRVPCLLCKGDLL